MSTAPTHAKSPSGARTAADDGAGALLNRQRMDAAGRLAIPAIIALSFVIMLCWSWRKWADIIIDFGRELYTPWQITKGQVLYRDIGAFYGPLSQYFNAALFEAFGVSLLTLVVCNIIVTLALLWLLFEVLRAVSGRFAATVACVVFVLLFACAHHLPGINNYNYITPYSHEAMHGLVLSVAAMFCVVRYQRSPRVIWVAGMGLALGLVFLTKPESFVAAAPAALVGLGLTLWSRRARTQETIINGGIVVFLMLMPLLAAWALLSSAMPSSDALRGALGSWPFLFDRRLTSLRFFREGMGTDKIGSNLTTLVICASFFMVALAPALLAGLMMKGRGRVPKIAAALGAAAVPAALLVMGWRSDYWFMFARPLPAFLSIAILLLSVNVLRADRGSATQLRNIMRLTMIAFSLLLLLKMIFLSRIHHYGFILAMPATMMLVVLLLNWIPSWIKRSGGSAAVVQTAALVLLAAIVVMHMCRMSPWLERRNTEVGSGADAIIVDYQRGPIVKDALAYLASAMRPDQTLVVMPEGVMLNYLLRRDSTVPYLTFLPPDLIMFDEQAMLEALKKQPPDFIALMHRPVGEYGFAAFGGDYAQSFLKWMMDHYDFQHPVVFGDLPYLQRPEDQRPYFGILIVSRRAGISAPL
jgi:hypothetical protein